MMGKMYQRTHSRAGKMSERGLSGIRVVPWKIMKLVNRKAKDVLTHRSRCHGFQANSYEQASCYQETWPSNYMC